MYWKYEASYGESAYVENQPKGAMRKNQHCAKSTQYMFVQWPI